MDLRCGKITAGPTWAVSWRKADTEDGDDVTGEIQEGMAGFTAWGGGDGGGCQCSPNELEKFTLKFTPWEEGLEMGVGGERSGRGRNPAVN